MDFDVIFLWHYKCSIKAACSTGKLPSYHKLVYKCLKDYWNAKFLGRDICLPIAKMTRILLTGKHRSRIGTVDTNFT